MSLDPAQADMNRGISTEGHLTCTESNIDSQHKP